MIDLRAVRAAVPVVVSGSDATDHPELYLRRGADRRRFSAKARSRSPISSDRLIGRRVDSTSVPGIAYPRRRAARCGAPAPRPFIKSLDELPFPAWDLVDVDRYRAIWHRRHGYYSMNIATTRGCPYHCNWCAKPIYGQRYAVRSPQASSTRSPGSKRDFAPDHLCDRRRRVRPEARMGRGVRRAVDETAGVASAVPLPDARRSGRRPTSRRRSPRAGCRMVWMGAESGSQRVLDAMEKGTARRADSRRGSRC